MPKQAIVQSSIEEVKIIDTPIPIPKDKEVVIKVVVSGTNPKDWKYPLWYGLFVIGSEERANLYETHILLGKTFPITAATILPVSSIRSAKMSMSSGLAIVWQLCMHSGQKMVVLRNMLWLRTGLPSTFHTMCSSRRPQPSPLLL